MTWTPLEMKKHLRFWRNVVPTLTFLRHDRGTDELDGTDGLDLIRSWRMVDGLNSLKTDLFHIVEGSKHVQTKCHVYAKFEV